MQSFTLGTLRTPDGAQAAIGVAGRYYPLRELQPASAVTVKSLLERWDESFPSLATLAGAIDAGAHRAGGIDAEGVVFETPVLYPNKLFAVGANYASHLSEMGLNVEKWPSMPFFLRPPTTSLVGPGETVRIPRSTEQFDWELELAVYVGRTLRHATVAECAAAIAGYTIGLDLSCRDLIAANNELRIDLMRGKAQDTMAPCGPYMVPAAFVSDPYDLRMQLSVNGRQMMDASTSEMLYRIDEQLSIISSYITIEPGDLLFTGSPSGSAAVHGGLFLKPGDRIAAGIDGLGTLEVTMRHD